MESDGFDAESERFDVKSDRIGIKSDRWFDVELDRFESK